MGSHPSKEHPPDGNRHQLQLQSHQLHQIHQQAPQRKPQQRRLTPHPFRPPNGTSRLYSHAVRESNKPTTTSEFHLVSPLSDLSDPSFRRLDLPTQTPNETTARRILLLENAPPPPIYRPPALVERGSKKKRKSKKLKKAIQQAWKESKQRVRQRTTNRRTSELQPNGREEKAQRLMHKQQLALQSKIQKNQKHGKEADGSPKREGKVKVLFKGLVHDIKEGVSRAHEIDRAARTAHETNAAKKKAAVQDADQGKQEALEVMHAKPVPSRSQFKAETAAKSDMAVRDISAMLTATPTSYLYDADEPTPLQTLDAAFAATMHQEDEYFNRLALVFAQSPFVNPSKYAKAASLLNGDMKSYDNVHPETPLRKDLPDTIVEEKGEQSHLTASSVIVPLESEAESVASETHIFSARVSSEASEEIKSQPEHEHEETQHEENIKTSADQPPPQPIMTSRMRRSSVAVETVHSMAEPKMQRRKSTVSMQSTRSDDAKTMGATANVEPRRVSEPAPTSIPEVKTNKTAPAVEARRVSGESNKTATTSRSILLAVVTSAEKRRISKDLEDSKSSNKVHAGVNKKDEKLEKQELMGASANPIETSSANITKHSQKHEIGDGSRSNGQKKGPRLADMLAGTKVRIPFKPTAIGSSVSIGNAQSFDSEDMTLRVTESAPSVLETSDYRSIALSKENMHAPDMSRPSSLANLSSTKNDDAPPMSPAYSISSAVSQSPAVPLVSNQAWSNAGFLFSPSYTGGQPHLIRHAEPPRRDSHAYTISTAESRSRLSVASSRSLPAFHIPASRAVDSQMLIKNSYDQDDYMSGTHRISKDSKDEKHVRFSDMNEMAEGSSQPVIETVVYPDIESKLSDLTDATSVVSHDVETLASVREENEEETVSIVSESMGIVSEGHWTYRDVNGTLVAATPMVANKRSTNDVGLRLATTKSPMLRFQAAKAKFAKPNKKKSPARKTPPKKFSKRNSSASGVVSNRITEINGRLRSGRPLAHKNLRRDTGAEDAIAPRKPILVNPLFRETETNQRSTVVEVGTSLSELTFNENRKLPPTSSNAAKLSTKMSVPFDKSTMIESERLAEKQNQNIMEPNTAPFDETVNIELQDNDDDSVSVASTESEDIFDALMKTVEQPLLGQMDNESDGEEEDIFAAVMNGRPSVGSSSTSLSSIQGRKLSLSGVSRPSSIGYSVDHTVSVISHSSTDDDEEEASEAPSVRTMVRRQTTSTTPSRSSFRSFLSKASSVPTVATDKENSTSYLPFANKKNHVNPCEQRHHAATSRGSLCLSPVQRTQLQARKWRDLAAAAKEKDRQQQKTKRGGGGLRVRNTNAGGQFAH